MLFFLCKCTQKYCFFFFVWPMIILVRFAKVVNINWKPTSIAKYVCRCLLLFHLNCVFDNLVIYLIINFGLKNERNPRQRMKDPEKIWWRNTVARSSLVASSLLLVSFLCVSYFLFRPFVGRKVFQMCPYDYQISCIPW